MAGACQLACVPGGGVLGKLISPLQGRFSRLGRTILGSTAAILLVVWLAVFWGLQSLHEEATLKQVQESNNISRVLQEQTTRVLAIVDKATLRANESTSSVLHAGSALPQIDTVRLATETGLFPEVIVQLGIVDADGRFRFSNLDPSGEKSGNVDLSDREHIRVHLKPELVPETVGRINANGLFIGKPVLGKVSGFWTIQVSRKLLDGAGERVGVVVASVNPDYFEKVFRDVQLGPSGTITLVGDDDIVRAQVVGGMHMGMGDTLKLTQQDRGEVKAAAYASFTRTDEEGAEHIVVSRRIPGYPLRLMVSTSTEWALANWYETRNITLILCVLLSLGAVGATTLFLRAVRRIESQSEEIRAQHQLQEMTMDAMQDGVLRLDRQGRIVKANPMALELLGVRKDAVIGARIDDVLPGEQNQRRMSDWFAFGYPQLMRCLSRRIADAGAAGPEMPIPLLCMDAEGQVVWATSMACELLGLDPAAPQPDALSVETTAQLLSARQADRQRPAAQQSQPHTVDIAWRAGDLRELQLPTLVVPGADDQHAVFWVIPNYDELLAHVIRSLHNTEWRILRAEGELIIPVLLTASPLLDPYHSLTGAVLSLKDVRDVKQQEEENLRMVKKMEQSQKLDALGQLAAGVAHDFNNLLGVIQSHAELVEMKVGEASPALKNVNAILQATTRAKDIVLALNSLGRDAKSDTGHDETRSLFDLLPLLQETQSLLNASLKGIDISLDMLGKVPEAIQLKGESGALQQVLVNLCVNASHAIGEGRKGRIAIELRCPPDGSVLLDIVDNGSGIPPEILPRIFEPFFTTKGVGKGTGLGLAMVHSIITKMGGSIDCQSEVGVGTRFSIRLPRVVQ